MPDAPKRTTSEELIERLIRDLLEAHNDEEGDRVSDLRGYGDLKLAAEVLIELRQDRTELQARVDALEKAAKSVLFSLTHTSTGRPLPHPNFGQEARLLRHALREPMPQGEPE